MNFQPAARLVTSDADDLPNLVRDVAANLRADRRVDAGLGELSRLLEGGDGGNGLAERLPEFLRGVRERTEALEQAALDVRRLGHAGLRLREILPFTAVGWPDERGRLERLAGGDVETALTAWLEYADRAAGDFRLDALQRLIAEGALPSGYERLRDRAGACVSGLQQRRYHRVAPFFADAVDAAVDAAGSEGSAGSGSSGSSATSATSASSAGPAGKRAETVRRLRLLLARLCVVDGQSADLERWLANMDDAAAYALRAAAQRAAGDPAAVGDLLTAARRRAGTDLDVVSETARQALLDGDFDRAREIAAAGIAALPTLFDVDHEIGKLVDPPSELWLAVAYRAEREGNAAALEKALVSAELRATGGPNENRIAALVADWRSGMASGRDRIRLLREAGEHWTAQGQLVQGRDRYAEALELLVTVEDAAIRAALTLRWADCVTTLAAQDQSPAENDPRRATLAAVLEALAVPGAAAADPWCHAVEFDARSALSARVDEPRVVHLWHGLLAAAKGVARMPYDARSWSSFADAAGMVGLRRLAIAAGLYTRDQLGDIGWSAALWASNSGEHQLAVELLAGTEEPWGVCLTADTYLRSGAASECTRLMSTVPIDPSWNWAQASHVNGVLLTRGLSEARILATRYLAEPSERVVEYFGLVNRAYLAVVAGDLDVAEQCLTRAVAAEIAEDQGAGSFLLGLVRILRSGDAAQGRDLMVESVAGRDRSYVEGWTAYEREVWVRLLDAGGVSTDMATDVLTAVDEAMARRLEVADLDCAVPDQAREVGVPDEVVDTGLALTDVLMTLLDGDAPAARAKFQAMDADLVADLDQLLIHLEYLCLRPAAGALLDLAAAHDTKGLRDGLRDLLAAEDSGILGGALYDEALDRESSLAEVDDALDHLAGDPETAGLAAGEVISRLWVLRQDLPVEETYDLQLSVPASWFEGYDDVVATHPIFERYLPDLRERHPDLPSVQVIADDELEPGGFRVVDRSGTPLTAGSVVPGARTCDPAVVDLLPAHLTDGRVVDSEGRAWFPAEMFAPADRVARLLTMDAQEYAVRRLLVSLDAPAQPEEEP